jgi:leucyl-tRNA synthetase
MAEAERTPRYDPRAVEQKWQHRWEESRAFAAIVDARVTPYYVLEMFPSPSGAVHMGHVRNYTIGDVIARQRRMAGFRVLHPIGWDAFGLPAENAAIKHGTHPARWTDDNIARMRAQLRRLGFSYDWDRELSTSRPEYYRWEQLFFLRMLARDLAYKRRAIVNWCPRCETVLANEQVVDGLCWRCDGPVEERELEQWFFRITAYAEELLADLDHLDGWPERVVTMQRNWIGRSAGAEIRFPLAARPGEIRVFTTRPDTLFGATFVNLAPEHPLMPELVRGTPAEGAVTAFAARTRATARSERTTEKEGVPTGAFCRHPLTGTRLPIWVANFVLMEYGTGAVMAVPAHDQRDFEFARAYDLPVRVVVQPPGDRLEPAVMEGAWEGPGTLVGSGEFDGLDNEEGKARITAALAARGLG